MDDPDPAGNIILQLLLLLVLILVNAFFAMSEIAVISLNDNKIQKMAEEGHKKAKQILRLTENSSNFLSTIQIGPPPLLRRPLRISLPRQLRSRRLSQ